MKRSPFVLDWKQKRSRLFGNVHNNHCILIDHIWIDRKIIRYLPIIHPLLLTPRISFL